MFRHSRIARVLLASTIVLLAAGRANAQQPSSKDNDPAYQEALKHFEEGKRLFREGQHEKAYFKFKAANALWQSDSGLWNLVASEVSTKRYLDAMRHLRQLKRNYPQRAEPSNKKFWDEWKIAYDNTAHISIAAPNAPAGTRIFVDTDECPQALTEEVDVLPGDHVVEARSTQVQRETVTATLGKVVSVAFKPPTVEPSPAPAPTNIQPPPAPATSTRDAGLTQPPSTFWTPRNVAGLAGVGATVIAAGTGVVFLLNASSAGDRADAASAQLPTTNSACAGATSGPCVELRNAEADRDANKGRAVAAFITAGGLAVVTAVVWLAWPTEKRSDGATTRLMPVISPTHGGLFLHHNF